MIDTLPWAFVACSFVWAIVRLFRATLTEDELWEEMHGRPPRRR